MTFCTCFPTKFGILTPKTCALKKLAHGNSMGESVCVCAFVCLTRRGNCGCVSVCFDCFITIHFVLFVKVSIKEDGGGKRNTYPLKIGWILKQTIVFDVPRPNIYIKSKFNTFVSFMPIENFSLIQFIDFDWLCMWRIKWIEIIKYANESKNTE